MTTADPLRSIEDRLLRLETKFDTLASKVDLIETKAELTEQISKLRDDLTVRVFQSFGGVVLLIVGTTFVNHFWK